MYKSKIALVAFALAGSFLGVASAQAGASTGTWKYSPHETHRYQVQQRGYYPAHRYGYQQHYRYEHHDRGHHYGWHRGMQYGSEQRYYR